jgi:hypothetical protein
MRSACLDRGHAVTLSTKRELGRFTCHHTDHGRWNSKWFHGRAIRACPRWIDFDQLIHVEVVGRGDLRWHTSCWVANWTIGNFCNIDKVLTAKFPNQWSPSVVEEMVGWPKHPVVLVAQYGPIRCEPYHWRSIVTR